MPTYYTTAQVVAAADALDSFTPVMRDRFFGSVLTFDTEEVIFDKVARRRKLAPFVSPNLPGKERQQRSREVRSYRPPYLKPKQSLNPGDAQARRAGEGYGGTESMLDRYDAMVMQTLADQENECRGREELMCCQALISGQVVCQGDGIDDTISYNRDAALSVALTSTARWGETGVNPLDSLRAWSRTVAEKSGAAAREVWLGYGAAELLTKDADLRQILDNRRQMGGGMELAGAATGGQDDVMRYIGSTGEFDFYEYLQTYETDADVVTHYWPQYSVGLIAPGVFRGHMCYGAIKDVKSLKAEKRFAKQWEEQDPSVEQLMTQSAPLPVPVEVNASFYATVR